MYNFKYMPALDINFLNLLEPKYNNYNTFVETGTLHGKTTKSLSAHFEMLHTIEVYKPNYELSKENLKNISNIKQYFGSSSNILPEICKNLNDSCIFFLDGHYSEGETGFQDVHVPLYYELDGIMKFMKNNCMIIIDDARLFEKMDSSVDWSKINENQILKIVNSRIDKYYYLPSILNSRDRLIVVLNSL